MRSYDQKLLIFWKLELDINVVYINNNLNKEMHNGKKVFHFVKNKYKCTKQIRIIDTVQEAS